MLMLTMQTSFSLETGSVITLLSCCAVLNVTVPYESNMIVSKSSFSFNRATGIANGYGGVACIENSVVTMVNCVLNDSVAALNAGVFRLKNLSIVIENSSFISNLANNNGGVLYTNEYQTNYTVRNSVFHNNTVRDGAVMYTQSSSNIEISAMRIMPLIREVQVFYIRGLTLAMDINSTFSRNTANSGGVLSACFSQVTVYGLDMLPDPEYPQYCSVYDEHVTDVTSTTETIMTDITQTTKISEGVTTHIQTKPTVVSTVSTILQSSTAASTHPHVTSTSETSAASPNTIATNMMSTDYTTTTGSSQGGTT